MVNWFCILKVISARTGQILQGELDQKSYEPSRAGRPPSRAESELNPSRAQLGYITNNYDDIFLVQTQIT